MAWESSGGWPKALGPCTRVGDLKEIPGSWLWIGAAAAVMVTWGMNHWMGDLSPPLCVSDFAIINK